MAKKAESRVQKRIQDRLKHHFKGSCFIFKTHGSIFQMAGLPDLVSCITGIFIAFEVKDPDRPRSKPSILQIEIMKRIQDAGGYAGVIETPDQAIEMVILIQQASISGHRSLVLKQWLADSLIRENGRQSIIRKRRAF
jgi:hypothetical protein